MVVVLVFVSVSKSDIDLKFLGNVKEENVGVWLLRKLRKI